MPRTAIAMLTAIGLVLPVVGAGEQFQIPLNKLLLQNFVDDRCHDFRPMKTVIKLDERFFNKVGWGTGATSCKGEICWSWEKGEGFWDWKLYSSNLPLRISNVEKISKSISQTIRNSQALRKSSNDVISAVHEFLQSSFGSGKERNITKERTLAESKTQEQSVETNITTLFHRFLAMAVQNAFPAVYPFCLSSSVELFYQAYNTNRVNDLVEAFVFFQTVKPHDLKLNNEKSFLNRAKLLYFIISPKNKEQEQFAWASAVLFAKLLEWDEFQDEKKIVDHYMDKVYEKFQLLKTHTAKELLELDRELAMFKYAVDKQLQEENKTQNSSEVEDRYAYIATVRFFSLQGKEKAIKEVQPLFEDALKKNDPLLNAKLITEPEPVKIVKKIKENPQVLGAGAGVIGIGSVAGILYLRKRKQTRQG